MLALIAMLAPRDAAAGSPGPIAATLLDRTVAVVGDRVITAREVTRQLRLQALYERQPVDDSPAARETALERLIERRLIQNEMRLASFSPDNGRAAAEMEELRKSTFASGMTFAEAVREYGLTERDVEQFVAELVDILRFIEFRFRTGLQITPEEVQEYYNRSYLPTMRRLNEQPDPLEEIRQDLQEQIAEQRVDSMLDQWLREIRAGTRVEVLRPEGPPQPLTGPIIPIGPVPAEVNP